MSDVLVAANALDIALVAVFVLAAPAGVFAAPPEGKRPTESFRREHIEVRTHLEHVRQWNGELAQQKPEEQRKTAEKIVDFFEKHIRPHAEWEEAVLYPIVDRLAGGGEHRFTSTMRYEHRIVGRWIGELQQQAAKPSLEVKAFTRRTDNLLGLINAHFEEEEEVLLPLIDRAMTQEQFEKEVKGAKAHK